MPSYFVLPYHFCSVNASRNPSERAFGAYAANQEIDVATQHNIFTANQDTAGHSKTSVQHNFQCVIHRINIPFEHSNYMNFTLHNEQNRRQSNVHRPRTENPLLLNSMGSDSN